MSKQIQPTNIWVNGEIKVAVTFKVIGIYDNYENTADNQWSLYTSENELIAQNNLTIDGQDYIDWGNQPAMSINDWIYNWSAGKLNLTIIP